MSWPLEIHMGLCENHVITVVMFRTQEMGHNLSPTLNNFHKYAYEGYLLINTESKSQITNIPLRRSNLIARIIDLIFFSIFPSDKENVIIFEA